MPMRDRLQELQQQRELLTKGSGKPGRESKMKKKDEGKTMEKFLSDASDIEKNLTKMKEDVAEIRKLQRDLISTPFPEKSKIVKYESLGEQVRHDATKIGGALKELEKKYDSSDRPDDSAMSRMRTQQLNTLTTELNISTNEFFRIQAEYMDKMKTQLRRQLNARGDATDEAKLNELLDQDSYNVFTDNYIADVHDAEQTLRDLEDRKKDLFKIEKSITEVNQLFKDMNLLVTTQGETLDTIEAHVETTTNHVEAGNVQLGRANQLRSRARRRKFCICGIILIVLIIIGIIIAIVYVA